MGAVLALVMLRQAAPGVPHRIGYRHVRRRESISFAARAMPLPGKAARDSHYANGIRVSVERQFLDMNDLGCGHQRRGIGSMVTGRVLW